MTWHTPEQRPYGPVVVDLGEGYVEGVFGMLGGACVLCCGQGAVCDWSLVRRWVELPLDAGRWTGTNIVCTLH